MKFIWNEPTKTTIPDGNFVANLYWRAVIQEWLHHEGVNFHPDNDHWICEYNYVYHFFDIALFECWLPGNGERGHEIQEMRRYLRSTNLDWSEHSTWTWDNHKTRPGVRFWIQAEDYPRKAIHAQKVQARTCSRCGKVDFRRRIKDQRVCERCNGR